VKARLTGADNDAVDLLHLEDASMEALTRWQVREGDFMTGALWKTQLWVVAVPVSRRGWAKNSESEEEQWEQREQHQTTLVRTPI
jgi:gluconate kinase